MTKDQENCGKCKFWGGNASSEFGSHCLRNAPSAFRAGNDRLYEVMASILWAVNQSAGVEQPKDIDWEPTAAHEQAYWPYTMEHEWCGEFVAGKNGDGT